MFKDKVPLLVVLNTVTLNIDGSKGFTGFWIANPELVLILGCTQ